jgi:hypothetical protein
MSTEKKTVFRLYTITDYEQEEQWLREMYRQGWKPRRFIPVGFYIFEKCEPEDMVFRLEFNDAEPQGDYLHMLEDYGWRYLFSCLGWRYYCKRAGEREETNELFTDDASKLTMLNRVIRRRMLPLIVIFLCCVLPNAYREFSDSTLNIVWYVLWSLILLVYCWATVHCLLGLRRLRKKYGAKNES